MRYLRLIAAGLFVASIPVFLITTNVRWVINAPALYSYGFDRYDIVEATGIDRGELIKGGRQIRDYFNNDVELLDLRVVLYGETVSLYNQREVSHMKDVKALVRGSYRAQELTGIYLVLFAALGLFMVRRAFLPPLARYAGLGAAGTLALVVAAGLASVVGFQQVFLAFHLVSFSNDLWQLDPSRDFLIAMFPQSFFFDSTMLVALSTVVEAAVVVLAAIGFLGWRGLWPVPGAAPSLEAEGA